MRTLRTVQKLPIDIQTAWEFFSSPHNLKEITPPTMGFQITSEFLEERMYPGMIISYKVKPLLNIPVTWVTEILHVSEPYYFVDHQVKGPYKFWHHQHHFREINGGIEMTDIVNYSVPLGFLGKFMEQVLVRGKLDSIFDYRKKKLEILFGMFG